MSRLPRWTILPATCVLLCPIAAQQPQLVGDLNQQVYPTPSFPSPGTASSAWQRQKYVQVLNVSYFTCYTPKRGVELYQTEGSSQTTRLVRDIQVGEESSMPQNLCSGVWRLFFTANTILTGRELYVTVPFTGECKLVKDLAIGGGNASSEPQQLFAYRGGVLFQARDEQGDVELYFSDGTAAGTGRIADLLPGPRSSDPRNFVAFGKQVYFQAFNGRHYTLWVTDGSPQGTREVATRQIDPKPGEMAVLDGRLYFTAYTAQEGHELWCTDGTDQGMRLVHDVYAGPSSSKIRQLRVHDGRLWFTASGTFPGRPQQATGEELWSTDGRRLQLYDLNAGVFNSHPEIGVMRGRGHGAEMFLIAQGTMPGQPSKYLGRELWRLNRRGVWPLDLVPGRQGSEPFSMVEGPGRAIYFVTSAGLPDRLIYRSDGSLTGTHLLARINRTGSGSGDGVAYLSRLASGQLLFQADDGVHGAEPWVSDGSAPGTRMLRDINPTITRTLGSSPVPLAVAHGLLYFQAQKRSFEPHIYATPVHGQAVIDLPQLQRHGLRSVMEARTIGDKLYLVGYGRDDRGQDVGAELWVLEPGGRLSLIDIRGGALGSFPKHLREFQGKLIFSADGDLHLRSAMSSGQEVWISDGTSKGTRLLADVNPGLQMGLGRSSFPRDLQVVGDRFYFVATTPAQGAELYVSDGSAAGTRLVADVFPGVSDGRVHNLTPVGNRLFFQAESPQFGADLWVTDGSSQGTVCLDLARGSASAFPMIRYGVHYAMYVHQGELFLAAQGDRGQRSTGGLGTELWRSDGTVAGTRMVADLHGGGRDGSPGNFAPIDGGARFVFFANDGFGLNNYHPGVYISDGTSKGTQRVADVPSGFRVDALQPVASLGSRHVVFVAPKRSTWGLGDIDLMITDGTAAGTRVLCDDVHRATFLNRDHQVMGALGDRIYVVRDTHAHGTELWFVEGIAVSTPLPPSCAGQQQDPRLRLADPVLGLQQVPLDLESQRARVPGVVFVGVWTGQGTELLPDCRLHLDLNGPMVFLPIATDALGRWRGSLRQGRARAGADYLVQAALYAPGPRALEFSNGVVASPGR